MAQVVATHGHVTSHIRAKTRTHQGSEPRTGLSGVTLRLLAEVNPLRPADLDGSRLARSALRYVYLRLVVSVVARLRLGLPTLHPR